MQAFSRCGPVPRGRSPYQGASSHKAGRSGFVIHRLVPSGGTTPTGHATLRNTCGPAPDLDFEYLGPPPTAGTKHHSNACAASRAVPVAVLCCCTLRPGCSNLASDQVELRGLEPLTPCLQTTGSTSIHVHPCRPPSWSVYPRPSRSVPVAVLSCCTPPPKPTALRRPCGTPPLCPLRASSVPRRERLSPTSAR